MAQRNLLNIPQRILARLKTFDQDDVVAGCAKHLRPGDVKRYKHLGLRLKDGELVLAPPVVPPPSSGRYSRANVEGKVVVRRDLPMIKKTFSWETPNYGDWSKGSHTSSVTRDVYQRDLIPPKEVELSATLIESRPDGFLVKFAVEQVLNRRSPDFKKELLYNLNILQENVGAVDVFPSAATLAQYAQTVRVDWEILPPGTVDEVLKQMLAGKRPIAPDKRELMEKRLEIMARLEPEAYIAGTSGFLRYFGAKFGEDFVVFENVNYGNAIYVMYENWEVLSQRSRIDLLKGPRDDFERIEHRKGWEKKLKSLLESYRKRTGGSTG